MAPPQWGQVLPSLVPLPKHSVHCSEPWLTQLSVSLQTRQRPLPWHSVQTRFAVVVAASGVFDAHAPIRAQAMRKDTRRIISLA